jgi:hypothetical protein
MSYPNHLTKFSNESYKHFMAKACLFWLLRNLKHDVATEWKVPNGYVDICDKTTRTLYEIEFHSSRKFRSRKLEKYWITGFELIIVDCSKMPNNINEIRKYLENFIILD